MSLGDVASLQLVAAVFGMSVGELEGRYQDVIDRKKRDGCRSIWELLLEVDGKPMIIESIPESRQLGIKPEGN